MQKNQIYFIIGGGCLLAFCAAATMLIAIIFVAPVFSSKTASVPDIVSIDPNSYPQADGNSMGDANAPIHIVEYGDFQCPYCKRFATQTQPLLIKDYVENGKVYFTYRSAGNWVSSNDVGNTESEDAAMSAYCASDQNKFWEMHDALFVNNHDVENEGAFSNKRLVAIAQSIGLNQSNFQDCFDSNKYLNQVKKDYYDAIAAGIQGTPFFVVTYKVNGEAKTQTIEGAQPINIFQQQLDAILSSVDK